MLCYNITFGWINQLVRSSWVLLAGSLTHFKGWNDGARRATERSEGTAPMATCTEKHHANHTHNHGPKCGHTAVSHDGHVDYLHDGHLHQQADLVSQKGVP